MTMIFGCLDRIINGTEFIGFLIIPGNVVDWPGRNEETVGGSGGGGLVVSDQSLIEHDHCQHQYRQEHPTSPKVEISVMVGFGTVPHSATALIRSDRHCHL